jgi:hypothetical protein
MDAPPEVGTKAGRVAVFRLLATAAAGDAAGGGGGDVDVAATFHCTTTQLQDAAREHGASNPASVVSTALTVARTLAAVESSPDGTRHVWRGPAGVAATFAAAMVSPLGWGEGGNLRPRVPPPAVPTQPPPRCGSTVPWLRAPTPRMPHPCRRWAAGSGGTLPAALHIAHAARPARRRARCVLVKSPWWSPGQPAARAVVGAVVGARRRTSWTVAPWEPRWSTSARRRA